MSEPNPKLTPFEDEMRCLTHEALLRARVAVRAAMVSASSSETYAACEQVLQYLVSDSPQLLARTVDAIGAMIRRKGSAEAAGEPLLADLDGPLGSLCRRLREETRADVEALRSAGRGGLFLAPGELLEPIHRLLGSLNAPDSASFAVTKVFDELLTERLPWIYADLLSRAEAIPQERAAPPAAAETAVAAVADVPVDEPVQPLTMATPGSVAAGIINRLVVKHRVPPFVDDFLMRHWLPVLATAVADFGDDAEQVQHCRDTCRAICWCASPARTGADRGKIDALLPKLVIRLGRGIESIDGDLGALDQFLVQVQGALHQVPDGSAKSAPDPEDATGAEVQIRPTPPAVDEQAPNALAGPDGDSQEPDTEPATGAVALQAHEFELSLSEESIDLARTGAGEAVNLETMFTSTISSLSIDQEMFAEMLGSNPAQGQRGAGDAAQKTRANPPLVDGDETSALFRVVQRDGGRPDEDPDDAE